MKDKLPNYFTQKFIEKFHFDDEKLQPFTVYDINDQISTLGGDWSSSKTGLHIPEDLDYKITKVLEGEAYPVYDEELYLDLIPQSELDVKHISAEQFDRMMSHWDFFMTFSELLSTPPLTAFEFYISLADDKFGINQATNQIFTALTERFCKSNNWQSRDERVSTFRHLSTEEMEQSWIMILKIQVISTY